jgi:large repetitive protein
MVIANDTAVTGPGGVIGQAALVTTDGGYVTAVSFGSRKGSHLQVISPEEIKIEAPAGSGTVNVRVQTAGGMTPVTTKDRCTY